MIKNLLSALYNLKEITREIKNPLATHTQKKEKKIAKTEKKGSKEGGVTIGKWRERQNKGECWREK